MSEASSRGSDWSEREVDLIVADYFAMLKKELAGEPYVKAHHNAALRDLVGRSHKSVEFKHQNISAVLDLLGLPWIRGYKPKPHFQRALTDGIERYLSTRPTALTFPDALLASGFGEAPELFVEPPPLPAETDGAPEHVRRLVRKFDPAERDARNRALGQQGEELVFTFERRNLKDAGRDDLARKVRWVSQEDGDGAGYDILSFDPHGKERLLEVKTTAGHQRTPFFISENERSLSDERPDAFRLVRLYDFVRQPRAFELTPPLENFVSLRAMNYHASFHK